MPATTKAVSVFTTDQVKQKQTRQRQNIRNKYASRSTLLDHYTWCHLYLEDVVYVYVYTGLCGSIVVHVYIHVETHNTYVYTCACTSVKAYMGNVYSHNMHQRRENYGVNTSGCIGTTFVPLDTAKGTQLLIDNVCTYLAGRTLM